MSFAMEPVLEEQGEESVDEGDVALPSDVLHAEHEALALQYKARQKMAEVKKLRKFYRKGEDGKKTKLVKCFVCDEPGHIARDCPKVKGTLNSSNQVLVTSSSTPSKTDAEAAEWDLLASLCCVTEESPNKDRAVYMVQRGAWMGEVDDGQSFNTGVVPHEAWWNMQELAKKVILDLGCMRNVLGVKWATDVIEAWFRFGDGNTLRSRYRLQLEATFGGRRVLLAFSVVPGPCPPLLSKQSHTKLGVKLDTEHHTMSSRKSRVQNYGLVETDAGHYTMRIDEFHLLPPDDETWKEAGKTAMLSDDEVALFEPAQPDAEVFGSVVDQLNSVPLDEVQPPSSSQSATMPTVRVFGASDKELSQHCGGKRRGALRDLGDTEHAGRGREAASQAGAEEHGTGSDSCSEPANSEVHQATKGGSSCQGLPGSLDRSSSGGVHGCSLAGVGPREEAALILKRRAKQAVSVSVELLEQRVDLQHSSQYGESAPDLSMEEAGVATPDQGGCEDGVQRKGNLEEKPEMADLPPELRDCGVVGALWGNEAEAEVNRLPESAPKPSVKPVKPQRGVTQKLKKGLEENWRIQELVAELIAMEDHYLLIELFAGCARLSRMAKNREGWVAMDPVDLIYGHDLKDKRTQKEILYLSHGQNKRRPI